ncbi:MAG: 2Fe-2S iron-sulfur cluster-binding protein, partial [Planctomycetota bacterium]
MKITIDGRQVEVSPGATVLDAARKLGIDVPSLCFLEGCKPSTSCLACLVKVGNSGRLVPACGTQAVEGMEVDSETAEVHQVRRTAL